VGAVERVVEAAPAGVGGVEGIARVGYGHHQLRTGDVSDLGIDVGSVDGEIRSLGDQIADVAEEGLVGGKVEKLPRARAMPIVDLRLQRIALCEKIAVPWRQVVHDAVEVSPERRSGYARAGQSLVD